jgi:outer membrane protein OmpA-like peptidoglycan-associated protein
MRRSYGEIAPEQLQSVLGQQRSELVRRLPEPVASVFESTRAPDPRPVRVERGGPAIRELPAGSRRAGGVLPLAVLASVFLLGLWLLRGVHRPVGPTLPTARPLTPTQTVPTQPVLSPRAAPVDALEGFLAGSDATPRRFDLAPMNFEQASALPTPESTKSLDLVAATLVAYPTARIRVESFTDNTGSEPANLQLTQARSTAVKDLLVQRGISPSRIEAQGRGQANPIDSNDTPEGRARNRRTEIVVTSR